MYHGSVPAEDIQRDAEYLQMSREDFMSLYLDVTAESGEYSTRHKPCDFLKEDGNCLLGGTASLRAVKNIRIQISRIVWGVCIVS